MPRQRWLEPGSRDLPVDVLLSRLRDVRPSGNGWIARCPAHADLSPSLSITETEEGHALVYCHAGCDPFDIVYSIDLLEANLFASGFAREFGQPNMAIRQGHVDRTIWPDRHGVVQAREPGINLTGYLDRHPSTDDQVQSLAEQLGLVPDSLRAIGIGYEGRGTYLFPERGEWGQIIGIVRRRADGSKLCVQGSHRGLVIPLPSRRNVRVYVAEGHTDTAAVHGVGCGVIGRPSARTGPHVLRMLISQLDALGAETVMVLGDRDDAGREGAIELARSLRRERGGDILAALPAEGYQDMREQIRDGAWDRELNYIQYRR